MISKEFLTAGKAIFTVSYGAKHFTYRVKEGVNKYARPGEPKTIFFVGVLTGSDNLRDYTCIGRMTTDCKFIMSQGATAGGFLKSQVAVFEWALKRILNQSILPDGCSIQHAGHCCRCARLLTTPESLSSGIGPECIKKMGAA